MRKRILHARRRLALLIMPKAQHDGGDCQHACCISLDWMESGLKYFMEYGTGDMTAKDVVYSLYDDLGK